MGDVSIASSEGIHHDDPLGPLLFSLALDGPLKDIQAEFMTEYLDDVSVGDTIPRLIEEIKRFESAALAMGLHLNHSKCEVIGLSISWEEMWEASGLNFTMHPLQEACFLGSPLHVDGVDAALSARLSQLERIIPRLVKLSVHEAFFLLKNCLGIPPPHLPASYSSLFPFIHASSI